MYKPAGIPAPDQAGMHADENYLFLNPTFPSVSWYQNNDGWSGSSRCDIQGIFTFALIGLISSFLPSGQVIASTPYPINFVIPGANANSLPNSVGALLLNDGNTLVQMQPHAKCTPDGPNTAMV